MPDRRSRHHLRMLLVPVAAMASLAVALAGPGSAQGASGTATVSVDVESSVSFTNNCTANAAWNLGTVVPGTPALTDTGASVCSFGFSSNNDSVMLRMSQLDGAGSAMAQASSTWSAQGTADDFDEVSVVDSTTAWTAASDGRVFRTTDSGATWVQLNTGITDHLYSIYADSATVAWAAGENGRIIKTTDGGATWTVASTGTTQRLRSIEGATASVLWAVGHGGTILKTADGGATWTAQASGTTSDFYAIEAVDGTRAWAGGRSGLLRYTSDGGTNWVAQTSCRTSHIWSIDALDGAGGAVTAGAYNALCRTLDWGATWTAGTVPAGVTMEFFAVVGRPTAVYAAGNRGIMLKSTDSGASWSLQESGTSNPIRGIDDIDGSRVWAVGRNDTVIRTDDGGANWAVQHRTGHTWYDVEMATADVAWTVGGHGNIARTVDGGATWTPQSSGETDTLWSVSVVDANTAFVAGAYGTILKTTNAGATWTTQASGTTQHLFGIEATSASTAFAVGHGGTILRTQDGGTTWTPLSSGTTYRLHAITALNAKTLVAVGMSGRVIRTADAGATWSTIASGTGNHLHDIDAGSETTLFVASSGGGVHISTDAGLTWTRKGVSASRHWAVAAISDTKSYVMGWDTAARSTDDGWGTWSGQLATNMPADINAVDALDSNTVIAVGHYGYTTRTSPAATITDYVASAWGTVGSGLFGVCLQAVSPETTPVWTPDTFGIQGQCQSNDTDPWRAMPISPSKVAEVTTPGDPGRVDVVWGMKAGTGQAIGLYTATVEVEVVAPNVT